MKKNIDIHADDYGYSLNTSKDILECIKDKSLDSISIICNTNAFNKSMNLLYKEIPNLKVLPLMSIHLNLVEGNSATNILPMGWGKLFLSSYSLNRDSVKNEIKKEIKEQIDKTQKVIDKCIKIAKENKVKCNQKYIRIDSHMHTHLIPVVWDALVEAIKENNYKVEYIRNPKEPLMPFLKKTDLYKTYSPINIVKNRILMFYSKKVDEYCLRNNLNTMYMWGLIMSGHMDFDRIEKVYPLMKEYADNKGRNLEVLFHPGLALSSEKSIEMSDENFINFNSSLNRHIEKDAVQRIKRL